ncbi:hypothetical protein [Actinomadura nitritigenes]|uniref:hypothetical protein n=1 Tax=Actinomadura nitritigenes TaxID=134602 RepID=UPI003D936978
MNDSPHEVRALFLDDAAGSDRQVRAGRAANVSEQWFEEFAQLWTSLGMKHREFEDYTRTRKRPKGINRGTLSLAVRGLQVPRRELVDEVLKALEAQGRGLSPQARDRLITLHRKAREFNNPKAYLREMTEDELTSAYDECDRVEDQVKELQQELERRARRLSLLEADHTLLQAEKTQLEKEIAALKQQLANAEQHLKELQRQCEELENSLYKLENPTDFGLDAVDVKDLTIPFARENRLPEILEALRDMGLRDTATAVAERVATDAEVDSPFYLALLLGEMRELQARDQALVLAERLALSVEICRDSGMARLLNELRKLGAVHLAKSLAERAVPLDDCAGISIRNDDPYDLAYLLEALIDIHEVARAEALAARAIPAIDISRNPAVIDFLRRRLSHIDTHKGSHELQAALDQRLSRR